MEFQVGDGGAQFVGDVGDKVVFEAVDFFEGADVVEAAHDGGIIAGVEGGQGDIEIEEGVVFVLGGDLEALLAAVGNGRLARSDEIGPRFGRNQVKGWPPFDFGGLVAE